MALKTPPLKTNGTKIPRLKSTKKIPLLVGETEKSEPTKKFNITFSDTSVSISFDNTSFGVKCKDKTESFMKNTTTKDNENITKILHIIKTYMKGGISFAKIADRLQKGEYATSIKVFLNTLSKPI